MSPLTHGHHATVTNTLCLLGYLRSVGLGLNASEVMRQEHETLVGARNEILHPNWWCLSIILEPRLGGCVDHTIDPKLKQTDFICGTSSGFRSSKVASFVSVACYQISRQLENGYAPKTYMQEFLRRFPAPWKCFLVRHDKYIHDTWTVVLE